MKLAFSILFIFSALSAFAQLGLSVENHVEKVDEVAFLSSKKILEMPTRARPQTAVKSVPLVYSYDKLAFFCKVEVKLENAVKFPVKFRLGSVDYVDRLEGKD